MVKRSERRKNPFREKRRFNVTDFPENSKVEVDEADGDDDDDDDGEEQDVVMDKEELVDMEG